jgi:hypothetical protein
VASYVSSLIDPSTCQVVDDCMTALDDLVSARLESIEVNLFAVA